LELESTGRRKSAAPLNFTLGVKIMKIRFLLITFLILPSTICATEIINIKAADVLLQCSAVFGYVSKITTKAELNENARTWYGIYFLAAQDLSSKEYVQKEFPNHIETVEANAFKNPKEMTNFLQNELNRCMKLENLDPEIESVILAMLKDKKTPNKKINADGK